MPFLIAATIIVILAAIAVFVAYALSTDNQQAPDIAPHLNHAHMAFEAGDDKEALVAAQKVLDIKPDNPTARDIACRASFNLFLEEIGREATLPVREVMQASYEMCHPALGSNPQIDFIAATYLRLLGHEEGAVGTWHRAAEAKENPEHQHALAALLLSDHLSVEQKQLLRGLPRAECQDMLLFALSMRDDAAAELELRQRLHPFDYQDVYSQQTMLLKLLFESRPVLRAFT